MKSWTRTRASRTWLREIAPHSSWLTSPRKVKATWMANGSAGKRLSGATQYTAVRTQQEAWRTSQRRALTPTIRCLQWQAALSPSTSQTTWLSTLTLLKLNTSERTSKASTRTCRRRKRLRTLMTLSSKRQHCSEGSSTKESKDYHDFLRSIRLHWSRQSVRPVSKVSTWGDITRDETSIRAGGGIEGFTYRLSLIGRKVNAHENKCFTVFSWTSST